MENGELFFFFFFLCLGVQFSVVLEVFLCVGIPLSVAGRHSSTVFPIPCSFFFSLFVRIFEECDV